MAHVFNSHMTYIKILFLCIPLKLARSVNTNTFNQEALGIKGKVAQLERASNSLAPPKYS